MAKKHMSGHNAAQRQEMAARRAQAINAAKRAQQTDNPFASNYKKPSRTYRVVGNTLYNFDKNSTSPDIPVNRKGQRLGYTVSYDPNANRYSGSPDVVDKQGRLIPIKNDQLRSKPKPKP